MGYEGITAPADGRRHDLFLRLTADPLAVRGALAQLFAAAPLAQLQGDARGTAELVLAEVLNNIVEHAYPDQAGPIAVAVDGPGLGKNGLVKAGLGGAGPDRGRWAANAAPLPGTRADAPPPVDAPQTARAPGLTFTIYDRGRAMPGGAAPEGRLAPLSGSAEDLPEGGFGWYLIRTLSQNLCYTRRGATNILTFQLPAQS